MSELISAHLPKTSIFAGLDSFDIYHKVQKMPDSAYSELSADEQDVYQRAYGLLRDV